MALTAAEIIAKARDNRAKQVQTVTWPGWDVELRLAPASAGQYYQAEQLAQTIASKQGRARPLQLETNVAWVAACVQEPQLTAAECYELANADPGQFEKLAQVCQAISQGTPLAIICLNVWAGLVGSMDEREERGEVPAGTARFWRSIVNGFLSFIDNAGTPDPKAVAQTILDADPSSMDAAADALDEFFVTLEADRKNASEGSSASGSAALSTPSGPPENSQETDGTGTTSPTSEHSQG